MDFVIELSEEEKKRFMQVVTEFAKAIALCATEPEAQETSSQIDTQLNQLISKLSFLTKSLIFTRQSVSKIPTFRFYPMSFR